MIPNLTSEGVLLVSDGGTPVFWNSGLGYDVDGRLCTTTTASASDVRVGGFRLSALGRVVTGPGDVAARPYVFNNGIPFDKRDGRMIVQTVAPVVSDPFVHGWRVGPLGGVYIELALSGALYNYAENAAQPPSGWIYHSSGANSLKINVVDANGVDHTAAIQSLAAGDRITIGTQSAYLTGAPSVITSGVTLTLVDSWPNYTNGQYTITINKGVLPYATVAPVISGNSLIGSTLTCTPGTWAGSPTPSVTRRWKADGNNIAGQTGLTYVTQAGDAGKAITCVETGTSLTGTGFSSSNAIVAATLPGNTVAPVISGGQNVGILLTTTNGTWTGLPAPTFTYHWFADGVATPGTEQTYTIRPIDAGKAITCVVTGTNPAGAVDTTSNAITAIQPPVNLTAPVVTGEGTPGQTLTCGTGTWNADPAATYAHQWKANNSIISGQTATTYVVQAGDVGKSITCAVTATNTGGSAVANSNGIFITAAAGQPPVNTVAPVISGTGAVGNILSLTSQGTWTGTPPINYTYQWQRDGANTGNAGNSYVVQAADEGTTITCRVTGTNVDGVSNALSNGITIAVAQPPVNTVAPVVSGNTPVGSVLSCTTGTWTGDATITYTYQWKKNAANISSQTSSTYTSVSGDVGATITCTVTGTNGAGNSSATSNGIVVTATVFSPASLFASGEQGAWYDPSDLTTLFQDSFGTTPVTTDGQPVGLVLDKSKGLALGSELITNGSFASNVSGWAITSGTGTLTWDAGTALIDATVNPAATQTITTVAGGFYKFTASIVSSTANAGISISNGSSFGFDLFYTSNQPGAREISGYFRATGTLSTICLYVGGTTGVNARFDNISVRLIAGNPAIQATSAARPLYKVTGIADWNDFDAVDDVLNTTFPSSLGSSCTVARANVGGAPTILTGQTIGTSYANSTDNAGLVITNDNLTIQETSDLTAWLTAKGATS